MKSGINPFDSQEAKPYKNDNEIVAMTNLVTAYQVHIMWLYFCQNMTSLCNMPYFFEISQYFTLLNPQNNDINEFEKILKVLGEHKIWTRKYTNKNTIKELYS